MVPNPDRVSDIKLAKLDFLLMERKQHTELYTPWFRMILRHYSKELMEIQKKSMVRVQI